MKAVQQLVGAYRASGADLPFGRPEYAHDVAMEGYFWRVTTSDRVLIALIGVNGGPSGQWATVGVALSAGPDGSPAALVTDALNGAWADSHGLAAGSGSAFLGDDQRLRVRLLGCELDVAFSDLERWPPGIWGGSSVFQMIPGLNQYWHPWLLGGRASGRAVINGQAWEFSDAQVYGEKNWGRGGFPDAWWWGQAHGFAERDACVAFAGGQVTAGPLKTEVTGLVVRLPDRTVVRLGNPGLSPVRATITPDQWQLRGRSLGWQIDVDGQAPPEQSFVLPVPLPSEHRNVPGALEQLTGQLTVTVRRKNRLIWQGRSSVAGLEHGGLAKAQAELRRRGGHPTPLRLD